MIILTLNTHANRPMWPQFPPKAGGGDFMNSNKATPLAVTEFVKVVGSGGNQRVVVEGTTPAGETVRVFVEPSYPQLGSLGGESYSLWIGR